jgi:hypothetical protein
MSVNLTEGEDAIPRSLEERKRMEVVSLLIISLDTKKALRKDLKALNFIQCSLRGLLQECRCIYRNLLA